MKVISLISLLESKAISLQKVVLSKKNTYDSFC